MDFFPKQLIILLTLITILVSFGVFGVPHKAEAQAPVFCVNCSTLINDIVEFGQRLARWQLEDAMKALTDLVAKRILDYIVAQTVQWVQNGGEPRFVQDWQGFLHDAANIAFDQIVRNVGAARLCAPFALQLRLTLQTPPRFTLQLQCTLDQFVQNINAFYGNFSQGGWLAYDALWQPNNNFYGQVLMIEDRIQSQTLSRVTAARNEALSGNGFLSVKRCLEPEYDDNVPPNIIGCNKYETLTPGNVVGQAIANAVNADTTWAASIRSWTSALINALISRLINEGLSQLNSGPIVPPPNPGPIPPPPGAPSALNFTNITSTTLRLNWQAASGADSYWVERCTGPGCNNFYPIAIQITNLYYDDRGLTGNTTYQYRVVGINSAGPGPFSNIASQLTFPDTPGLITFSNVTTSTMQISWAAPDGGAPGYKVERCAGTGCGSFSQIAAPSTNSYSDSGLTENTIYRYRVRASNATGDSAYNVPAEQATLPSP